MSFDYDTEELINQFSIKKLLLPRIRDEKLTGMIWQQSWK